MLALPALISVSLPHPAMVDAIPWWSAESVAVMHDRVRCERGDWIAEDAHAMGVAIVSGALVAGAAAPAVGHDLVAPLPPTTPLWGDPGHVYFPAADTYVVVDLRDGPGGAVWINEDLVSADVALSEGLAIVAAARLICERSEVAA